MEQVSGAAPSVLSLSSSGRRKLLFAVVGALVVMLAAYLVVHGSTPASHKHKHKYHGHRQAVAAACATRTSRSRKACLASRRTVTRAKRTSKRLPLKAYATALLPVVGRTRGLLDGMATSVSTASSLDGLGRACATYGPQVQVLADQFEGIPHPYPGYTVVGSYHHAVMGIYHQVQGALDLCDTAVSNADSEAASNAVADITSSAGAMRATADDVQRLARH